jgi:hypothetical protein
MTKQFLEEWYSLKRSIYAAPPQQDLSQDKLHYWVHKLEGLTPLILPADYSRTAKPGNTTALRGFAIDEKMFHLLQQFSRLQGVSLFMTVFAVLHVLLHRYSGQEDICVGGVIVNPKQSPADPPEFNNHILPLRNQAPGTSAFAELLQGVNTTIREAFKQGVSLELILERVKKELDISYHPLVGVSLIWQEVGALPLMESEGDMVSQQPGGRPVTSSDLIFGLKASAQGLEG